MPGRPSKLTPARHDAIIASIESGNYFDTACSSTGITRQAAYLWLERGQAERTRIDTGITDTQRAENGDPPAHQERRYLDFFDAVERARALAEERHLRNIERLAMGGTLHKETLDPETGKVIGREYHLGDWRASAFYLERARTQRWGRRQTVEVSGPEGGPVGIDVSDGQRLAEQVRGFFANVRNDPRILEARVESSRTELIGSVPAAIEQGGDGSDDDAR